MAQKVWPAPFHFNAAGEPVDPSAPAPEYTKRRRFSLDGVKTMQVRAKTTFQSRYGFIRAGEVFTAEEGYGQQLIIGGKVVREGGEMKPDRRQTHTEAPLKKDDPMPPPPASENPKDAGTEKRSLLSRAVRRRPVRTPTIADPAVK
jgi:hypothetical protein